MRQVTPEMIDMVFSESTNLSALLCTITAEGLPEPIRVTNLDGGLTSRGVDYEYYPFSFSLPGASESEQIRECQLEIYNRDQRISNAIRTSTGKPRVTVEYVKVSNPDYVELALTDAEVYDVEIDDPRITATIRSKSFALEPACKARYVAARTPGLF